MVLLQDEAGPELKLVVGRKVSGIPKYKYERISFIKRYMVG